MVMNGLAFVIFPVQGCQGKRVVLESKKGVAELNPTTPEKGTKKAKETSRLQRLFCL